jgi:hypothetical protein
MAALRSNSQGIPWDQVTDLVGNQAQGGRAIAGLLADGLAERTGDRLTLPVG